MGCLVVSSDDYKVSKRHDKDLLTTDLVHGQSDETKISDHPNKLLQQDQMASLSLKLTPDKMLAFLSINPDFPVEFDDTNLLDYLACHRIIHGLCTDRINSLIRSAEPVHLIPIAAGTPCGKGKNGQVVYFHKLPVKSPRIDEQGKVNFHDIQPSIHVKKGDIIAAQIPPTRGNPGFNVYGEEIPGMLGDEGRFKTDGGIIIKGNKAIAAMDGTLSWDEHGNVSVSRFYRVNNDVNFATGNINFDGDVCIKGNVKPGFIVHAEGDIRIGGLVDNAEVVSKTGSIIVDGPILGRNQLIIKAGCDVKARYIQNATVEAGNSIFVDEYVTRSCLKAGNRIDISRGKGLILGKNVICCKNVLIVNNITNPEEVRITIEGFNPDDYKKRIAQINNQIEEGTNVLSKLAQSVSRYPDQDKNQEITEEYEQWFDKTRNLERHLELLYLDKLSLEEVLRDVVGRGMVHILQGLASKLDVTIRGIRTTINSSYGKTRIYYDQESRMIRMD